MGLRISRAVIDELIAHAAKTPDVEVCGLLFEDGSIEHCINVAEDPARAFEIDPTALITAHKAERAGGRKLIGCYHSHPNGVEEPSARDAAMAAEGQIWLIVADAKVAAWQSTDTGFAPLILEFIE
jgi:proteasome lid subunit RPN8/RPN11